MSYLTELKQLRGEVDTLVAHHEEAQSISDFSVYADDPVGFMVDVLRCEPWLKQREMAEAVRDNRRVAAVTCNGLGKDWITARIALWWVFARAGFAILSGPTERQVREILMREVRRAFARAPELPGELFALSLRVTDDCGILAFTSDNADKLTGFHHERLLVCLTEGQGVDESAYEAAQACCTGPGNRLFVYGNPTAPAGPFYRAAEGDNWTVLTVSAHEHPNVITGRIEIPGAVSREWIDEVREEYGETSSIYRSRVLALFPEDSIEGLVRREWLRAAFDRHESQAAGAIVGRRVLSLDVARYGPDASCMAVVCGSVVEKLIVWRGASTVDSAERVIQYAESLTPVKQALGLRYYWDDKSAVRPAVIVDEPGLGAGTIDVLRARGWPAVAFNGASAAEGRRFANLRAASYWRFRELLEQGRIALPRDRELEEELLATEWQINTAGQIQIVGKDTIRKTLGRSPDRADAAVMGIWEAIGAPAKVWGASTFRI